MGEFSDGFTVASRLIECERQLAEHMQSHLNHELDEGAHAAAFDAHNQSPGVVEQAEELAAQILETAEDTADTAIEAIEAAAETAVESVETAPEVAAEIVETPVEAVAAETPAGEGERPPARPHPLHRKVFGN